MDERDVMQQSQSKVAVGKRKTHLPGWVSVSLMKLNSFSQLELEKMKMGEAEHIIPFD